jgi:glycine/D-amino acid oxidase-like deaminating enzyme
MSADVVVVGAGIVGAACAYYAARAGLQVTVVDRGPLAGGTTGAGEGNLLVSDKEPGPELELALLSRRLWLELAEVPVGGRSAAEQIELEHKGGLVVAASDSAWRGLAELAAAQRAAGVESTAVPADALPDVEPQLAADLAGGYRYPQDMQVQPMLATAVLLRLARGAGARVLLDEPVVALLRAGARVVGVRTIRQEISAAAVVNAAGAWASQFAALAEIVLPVAPRRGFVLVTEPLPPRVIRHKVYFADYVADVASDSAALQASAVVEGTASGPVLIGATRERVGFERTWSPAAVRTLAEGAVRLFPFLAHVAALRGYRGFRPYCPDHLPVIGPDPRAPGLLHAAGHEGAGIGLSVATGQLIAQSLCDRPTELSLHPFRPERFAEPAA